MDGIYQVDKINDWLIHKIQYFYEWKNSYQRLIDLSIDWLAGFTDECHYNWVEIEFITIWLQLQ